MTNYMVCLAHFCELHGPSVIACTQIIDERSVKENLLLANSRLASCLSCQFILPDSTANLVTKLTKDNEKKPANLHKSASPIPTPTPTSTPTPTDLILEKVSISTHYPSSQKRYSALTKLVMKSPSVETMSDLSKPMFYGDAINGYCINQIFKVEDLNARGGERKYSLMVISDNESELLMRWEIVSIYFNVVIELIQKKVAKANQVKQSESNNSSNNFGDGDSSTNKMFDNERYLRRSLIKPKSLTELTNDNEIFVRIHLCVTEMLKDILG